MKTSFRKFALAVRSRIPVLGRANTSQFSRRYERHECVVVGAMGLVKVGAEYPGVILELSCGGCSFRPASHFLLDRAGEAVTIRCDYFEIDGIIKATRPESYGIMFLGELTPDIVERVKHEHGGPIAKSFLGAARKEAVAA